MNIFWFITLLLLLHSCTPGDCIVGGNVSVPHSRPYMVYIQDSKTKSACGVFLVYLGINNTKFLPHGIEVDSFSHPDFENKPGNDIMLLKLKTPATLNETVRIIDLPKPWNEKISKDCLVMGWGSSYFSNYSPSEDLKELNMALGDLTNCQPDILCSEGNVGPAQGDSGGPLVCGDIAQGVTSFNLFKTKDYVTGYTLISQHLLWINKIMRATHQIQSGIHIKGKAYYRVGRDDGYRESSKIKYMPKNNKTLTKIKQEEALLQLEIS